MKNILFIIVFLFGIANINAQNSAAIRGKIIAPDGQPLPGANIVTQAFGKTIGTTTDMDGYFVLKPLPEGKFDITVSFIGYANYTVKEIELSNDQIYFAKTIKLSDDEKLPEVVVAVRKPIDADQTINKMTLKAADLKNMPTGGSISNILRAISTEIQVDNNNKIILRGSRPGNSITIVDDVKSMGDASVPGLAIGSVTVYTGGIPAKYGDFTGGVVLIQTKSFFDYYYQYKD